MSFIFEIPSSGLKELEQWTGDDNSKNVYVVETALTLTDVQEMLQEVEDSLNHDQEPDFIFKNFDLFFHALKLYSMFDQSFRDRVWVLLRQLYQRNLKDLKTYLENPERSERQAVLNRLKMLSFLFFTCCEYNEDKALAFGNRQIEEEAPSKKRPKKNKAEMISSTVYHRSKSNVLLLLVKTLTLKLEQLFDEPIEVQTFVNFMLKYVYTLIENLHGFKNDQDLMRSLCDVFQVAILRYEHSQRFCQKVLELLQNSEELSSSLAALVIDCIKNGALDCNFLMARLAKIQINDLSKDSSAPKAVSQFLIDVGKNCSDQMLNCLSTLELMLDQDSHMVRNTVFEINYTIIVEHFRQVDNYRDINIRDQLMNILEDYILDLNGYCRSKVIKLWTLLAEAELIDRERYNTITPKIAARLKDKSNFVRKSALAFLTRVCHILIPCQGLKDIFNAYHEVFDGLKDLVVQQNDQTVETFKELENLISGGQSIKWLKEELMNGSKDEDDEEDEEKEEDDEEENDEEDEEEEEGDEEKEEDEEACDSDETEDDENDELNGENKKRKKKRKNKTQKKNAKKKKIVVEEEIEDEEEQRAYAANFEEIVDIKTLVSKWNKIRLELYVFMQTDDDFKNGLGEMDEEDLQYHNPMLAFNHFRKLLIVKDFTKAMSLLPALKRKYVKSKEFEVNQNNDVFLNNFLGPVDGSLKLVRQIFLYPLLEMAEQKKPKTAQSTQGNLDAESVRSMFEKLQNDCAERERQQMILAKFGEIMEIIDQYDSFHDIITESLPKIYDMLNSTIVNDVLEAIDFFVMANNLKLKNSEKGVQKMLLLIHTKDKSVKDRLLLAFNQIFMNEKTQCDADRNVNDENEEPDESIRGPNIATRRDDVNKINCFREIKNLLDMIKPLNQGELICVEHLISEMYGKGMFSKTHINILWGLYRGKIERTPAEQRFAFILLGMIACSDSSIILDQLQHVSFSYLKTIPSPDDSTPIPDYELAMNTSHILSRIYPVPTIENGNKFFKIENEHPLFKVIFRLLLRGLKCNSSDPEYKSCKLFYNNLIIRSMEVIYLYAQFPDRLIREIMFPADDFIRGFTSIEGHTERIMTPYSNMGSQDVPISQGTTATSVAVRVNTVCLESDYIERFLYLITAVTKGFLLHMGHNVLRESQIRKKHKDMEKQKIMEERKRKKASKMTARQNNTSRTENDYSSSDDDDANAEFGGSMGNDCTVPDYIQNQIFDVELLNNNGFLSKYFNFVKGIAYDILGKRFPTAVRIAAWHAMCNFMITSKNITLKYRSVFSDCLTNCPDEEIRAILITYWGDILMRFPNQIEYLNVKLFNFLLEESRLLKTTALKTLSMIILADMLKPTGEIVHMAKLIVDSDEEIQDLTKLFFFQIANKDNQNIYNYLTDVISTHAGSNSIMTEEEFQEMVKFLFDLLEKNKSTESLVKKLAERFLTTSDTRLWRDLSFALQLVNYQEKSLAALLGKWTHIRATLNNTQVLENFQSLLQKLQAQHKESKAPSSSKINEAIRDLEAKLECFKHKSTDSKKTQLAPVVEDSEE